MASPAASGRRVIRWACRRVVRGPGAASIHKPICASPGARPGWKGDASSGRALASWRAVDGHSGKDKGRRPGPRRGRDDARCLIGGKGAALALRPPFTAGAPRASGLGRQADRPPRALNLLLDLEGAVQR